MVLYGGFYEEEDFAFRHEDPLIWWTSRGAQFQWERSCAPGWRLSRLVDFSFSEKDPVLQDEDHLIWWTSVSVRKILCSRMKTLSSGGAQFQWERSCAPGWRLSRLVELSFSEKDPVLQDEDHLIWWSSVSVRKILCSRMKTLSSGGPQFQWERSCAPGWRPSHLVDLSFSEKDPVLQDEDSLIWWTSVSVRKILCSRMKTLSSGGPQFQWERSCAPGWRPSHLMEDSRSYHSPNGKAHPHVTELPWYGCSPSERFFSKSRELVCQRRSNICEKKTEPKIKNHHRAPFCNWIKISANRYGSI